MISKKYIKSLDFETIEDIFKYIVESKINGAISQFKELINKLSQSQYIDFINYINDWEYLNNDYISQKTFKDDVIKERVL